MPDIDQLVRRAAASAPAPGFDLEDVRGLRRRHDRRRKAEAIVVGLAVAAAAIAIPVAVFGTSGGTSDHVTSGFESNLPAAWGEPLQAAADEYLYVSTTDILAKDGATQNASYTFRTGTVDAWLRADASGRLRSNWSGSGNDADRTYGPGEFTDAEKGGLAKLPSDPGELLQQLVGPSLFSGSPVAVVTASPGQSKESARLTQVAGSLLENDVVVLTPAQRAAFMDALSTIKGDDLSVSLHAEDPVGRPAYLLEFTADSGPTRWSCYVDPGTHDLLAVVGSSPFDGHVWQATILDRIAIADSTTDVPPQSASEIPAPAHEPQLDVGH